MSNSINDKLKNFDKNFFSSTNCKNSTFLISVPNEEEKGLATFLKNLGFTERNEGSQFYTH
jgi:hypothetical protein